MSRGNRIIPEDTKDKVLAFIDEGYTYAAAGRLAGVSPDTARSIWQQRHPRQQPPCVRAHAVPLKPMRSYWRRCLVIDYECPHCGALIHHAVIDRQEKPWRCPYCGREAE